MKRQKYKLFPTPSSPRLRLVYQPEEKDKGKNLIGSVVGICIKEDEDKEYKPDRVGIEAALEVQRLQFILWRNLILFTLDQHHQLIKFTLDQKIWKIAQDLHNQRVKESKFLAKQKNSELVQGIFCKDLFFSIISFLTIDDKVIFQQISKRTWILMNTSGNEEKIWSERCPPLEQQPDTSIISKTKTQAIIFAKINRPSQHQSLSIKLLDIAQHSPQAAHQLTRYFKGAQLAQALTNTPQPDQRYFFIKIVHAVTDALISLFQTTVTLCASTICILALPLMASFKHIPRILLSLSLYPIVAIIGSLLLGAYYGWKYNHSPKDICWDGINNFLWELFVGDEPAETWSTPFKVHLPFQSTLTMFFREQSKCTVKELAEQYDPQHSQHLPKIPGQGVNVSR